LERYQLHAWNSGIGEAKPTDKAIAVAINQAKGCNTIEKIVTRWAPPNENNTVGYIANVEKWSGVIPNKPKKRRHAHF